MCTENPPNLRGGKKKQLLLFFEQLNLCLNMVYLRSLQDANVSKFPSEYKVADTAERKPSALGSALTYAWEVFCGCTYLEHTVGFNHCFLAPSPSLPSPLPGTGGREMTFQFLFSTSCSLRTFSGPLVQTLSLTQKPPEQFWQKDEWFL